MNKKLITASIASFVLGAAIFIGASGTFAANNGMGVGGFQKGPAISEEQRTAIDTAIENGDYQAWVTAMGDKDSEVMQKINEDNFARFAEAHRLMVAGRDNMEQARAIMEDLGISRGGPGEGRGMMGGRSEKGPQNRLSEEQRTALDNAFQNGDYSAWVAIEGNSPMAGQINESNFARFAEAHRLMQSGDMEGARAIFQELGLSQGFGNKVGGMMGQKGGRGGFGSRK